MSLLGNLHKMVPHRFFPHNIYFYLNNIQRDHVKILFHQILLFYYSLDNKAN